MPLHFHDEDWARIERDYPRWWAHELERPLVQITGKEYDPAVSYAELKSSIAAIPWAWPQKR
jgi:hypothetical protein